MSKIDYSGKVTITTYKNNKYLSTRCLDNNGTPRFFNILLKFLAGNLKGTDRSLPTNTISDTIPMYFDIVYFSNENDKNNARNDNSILIAPIVPRIKFNDKLSNYTLSFDLYLDNNLISSAKHNIMPADADLYFVLKNNLTQVSLSNPNSYVAEEDGILAIVHTCKGKYPIDATEVQEISWRLSFSNREEL